MRMFIDDERMPPYSWEKYDFVLVRSYDQAIDFFKKYGCPKLISFDHDLGTEKSGLDIAKALIEMDMNSNSFDWFIPEDFEFTVHSMNPVGALSIYCLLNKYILERNK